MRRAALLLLLPLAVPALAQDRPEGEYTLPPLDDLRAVAERPLFMPGRRGTLDATGAATAATPAPALSAPLMLAGIGRRGDGQGVALLRQGAAARALTPGQEWAGWRLLAVGGASVDLLSPQGQRRTLRVGQPLSDPESK